VGYTNAGKSTLLNTLTQSDIVAEDKLFATLDPTSRRLRFPRDMEVVITDTVGFIRHLPHDLVAAFKATLQETREATLLLHIVDCSDECYLGNIDEVQKVLDEIDAGEVPQLMVMNKIDVQDDVRPHIDFDDQGKPVRIWLSAQTGSGIELLFEALTSLLSGEMRILQLAIPVEQGKLRALLYQMECVESESYAENGDCLLDIRLNNIDWQRLLKQQGHSIEEYVIKAN
jgi:GTP-binding protein HflX